MSDSLLASSKCRRLGDCAQCETIKKARDAYEVECEEYSYFKDIKKVLEEKLEEETIYWLNLFGGDTEGSEVLKTRELIEKTEKRILSGHPDLLKSSLELLEQISIACKSGCSK